MPPLIADDVKRLVDQLWHQNAPTREIAERTGLTVKQINNYCNRVGLPPRTFRGPGYGPPIASVADLAHALAPVVVPALPRGKVTKSPAQIVVVYSDTHFGYEDGPTLDLLYQTVAELRPKLCIANGDVSDLGALGVYPRNMRPENRVSLRDEQQKTKSHWRTLGGITQAWGGTHIQTNANHDGENVESRWERYMSDRLGGEVLALEGMESFTYSAYFHHPDVPVRMVDELILPGALRVRHGRKANKHGGSAARAQGWDQLLGSILVGHSHRQGYTAKRVPAVGDLRGESVLRMWEGGCCCKLSADYAPDADWTNGFAIVHVDDANDTSQVELVTVERRMAVVPSLGKTLKAA